MRTKRPHSHTAIALSAVLTVATFLGCSNWAMHGGTVVSEDDLSAMEFLVDYRGEGVLPDGATYHLVQTANGLAIFEHAPDGGGTLFENHWNDSDGDHFASWVHFLSGGPMDYAWEFVVPTDRSKEVIRYAYDQGSYNLVTIDGVKRPVPKEPIEPTSRLFPIE